ncbi:MAG: hypothetical protein M3O36_21575 [Myxococcota bacterium]|nr:hypothetical protein [Myxococcota bacterium]
MRQPFLKVEFLCLALGGALAPGCSSGSAAVAQGSPDSSAPITDSSLQTSDGGSGDAGRAVEGPPDSSGAGASVDAGAVDASATAPSGDAGVDPDLVCYGLAATGCAQCCAQRHPAGDPVYNTAFDDCFCAPPNGVDGLCQTQCAGSDCSSLPDAAPAVTGDPCDLCVQSLLGDGGSCRLKINSACQPNPDCVLYERCIDQCP